MVSGLGEDLERTEGMRWGFSSSTSSVRLMPVTLAIGMEDLEPSLLTGGDSFFTSVNTNKSSSMNKTFKDSHIFCSLEMAYSRLETQTFKDSHIFLLKQATHIFVL